MQTMYQAIQNSPPTSLINNITASDTTIQISDSSLLPAGPNLAVIGDGINCETILYTSNVGNVLSGVTRGFQGTAQAWSSGTVIARNFTAYDHDTFKANIEAHETILAEGIPQASSLVLGSQVVNFTGDTPVYPIIDVTCKHLINILGHDGDCENISKWSTWQNTLFLDTTNKVYGGNGYKATLTNTNGTVYKQLTSGFSTTKYYMLTAYLKNGTLSSLKLNIVSNGTGNTPKSSAIITSTTGFTRVIAKFQPTDFGTGATQLEVQTGLYGTNGQYGYIDGVMFNEISATDYSLTDAELLAKYPFVNSIATMQNISYENRLKNLLPNGNGEKGIQGYRVYNLPATTPNFANGYFNVTTDGTQSKGLYQYIPVISGATYSYRYVAKAVIGTGRFVIIQSYDDGTDYSGTLVDTTISSTSDTTFTGTITVDAEAKYIKVLLLTSAVTGDSASFKEVQVVYGSTQPTQYETGKIRNFTISSIDGGFLDSDYIKAQGDKKDGKIYWKKKILLGATYPWQYGGEYTGYKYLKIVNAISPLPQSDVLTSWLMHDYSGTLLTPGTMVSGSNIYYYDSQKVLYLSIPNTTTGWVNGVNPNDDEAKLAPNGWKAVWYANSRYCSWVSITDDTIPSIAPYTLSSGTNAAGQNIINVLSASNLSISINDWITYKMSNGAWQTDIVTAINGNAITVVTNLPFSISDAAIIFKCDNPIQGTTWLMDWCKNNVAPNFNGYKYFYKLLNPEPVSDANVKIEGETWNLEKGINHITASIGVVNGELANVYGDAVNPYYINSAGVVSNTSRLKYPSEKILTVYRNLVQDNKWSLIQSYFYARGNDVAQCAVADYDVNAVYTVDYKILKSACYQYANSGLQYSQGLISTVKSQSVAIDSKQTKSEVFDDIIDLSKEESGTTATTVSRGVLTSSLGNGTVMIFTTVVFKVRKDTIPKVILRNIIAYARDSNGIATVIIPDKIVLNPITRDHFVIVSYVKAGTIATNLLNYGGTITASYIAKV